MGVVVVGGGVFNSGVEGLNGEPIPVPLQMAIIPPWCSGSSGALEPTGAFLRRPIAT